MISSILIIEDDATDAQLIHSAMITQCRMITVARSLEDGLLYLTKHAPDVILLDVGLPGYSDPDQVIAEIKKVRNDISAIVVVSGTDDPDVITRALLAECSGWLVKGRWQTLQLEVRAAYDNHRHHMRRQAQNREIRARLEAVKG